MHYCEMKNIKIYHKHLEICEKLFLYLFIYFKYFIEQKSLFLR